MWAYVWDRSGGLLAILCGVCVVAACSGSTAGVGVDTKSDLLGPDALLLDDVVAAAGLPDGVVTLLDLEPSADTAGAAIEILLRQPEYIVFLTEMDGLACVSSVQSGAWGVTIEDGWANQLPGFGGGSGCNPAGVPFFGVDDIDESSSTGGAGHTVLVLPHRYAESVWSVTPDRRDLSIVAGPRVIVIEHRGGRIGGTELRIACSCGDIRHVLGSF